MEVDLLIIGGGLVGSSLAAAVASHPLSRSLNVVVVDPKPPSVSEWPATSLRTSTITPSSKVFLEDIGVWTRMPAARIAPFDKMFVWDHPRPLPHRPSHDLAQSPAGTLVFDAAEVNEDALGFVVDNDTLRNALFRRMDDLTAESELRIINGAVQSIDYGEEATEKEDGLTGGEDSVPWPLVTLASGEQIRARLIAACDGARSRVRTLAGGDWFSKGYDQAAVVANVMLKDPTTTAFQRFVSTGPVAVLPVASEETSAPLGNVIWTTTRAEAAALASADDAVFIDELNVVLSADEDGDESTSTLINMGTDETGGTGDVPAWSLLARGLQAALPRLEQEPVPQFLEPPQATRIVGARGSFPLSLGHASRYVLHEKRTVLVGDAAHCVHPLAGQGVNLGFADAECLAGCVSSAAGTGRDFGGEMGAPLGSFEGERMVANLGMIGLLHGLTKVFGVEQSGMRGLRRAGISTLNVASPVKKLILRAMR